MDPNLFFNEYKAVLEKNYPGINELIWNTWFSKNEWQHISNIESRLKNGEPLEYIFEKGFFFNNDLIISKDVLIPRYETEVLVEEALMIIKSNKVKSAVDIGTGSGAIGLAILRETNFLDKFIFTDISEKALATAKLNHSNLQEFLAKTQVEFLCQDRIGDLQGIDLIISNPPYIPRSQESNNVHKKVAEFEPELALYIDDDSYDRWFQIFFTQALHALNDTGFFLMEGHEDIVTKQEQQLYDIGFSQVHTIKDLQGKNRHLCAQK